MERPFGQQRRSGQVRMYGSRMSKGRREETNASQEDKNSVSTSRRTIEQTYGQGNRFQRDARQTTPSRTSASTSPTDSNTPFTPHKQAEASQTSTPSPSPTVKLDLRRDVYKLLSPRKKRKFVPSDSQEAHDSASDEDEVDSFNESSSQSIIAQQPSKSSFASRMAARRPKPPSKTNSTASPAAAALQRPPNHIASATSHPALLSPLRRKSGQQSATLMPTKMTRRTYGMPIAGVHSPKQCQSEDHVSLIKNLEASETSDTNAMKARWEDLDDMEVEEQDQELNLKSIINLRSTGEYRRFMDEFDYLTMNLDARQSIRARRNAFVEMLKRIHTLDEGSESESEVKEPSLAKVSAFIVNMRTSQLTSTLLDKLQEAGAGRDVKDYLLDVAFCLICVRIFSDGMFKIEDLTSQSGSLSVSETLVRIMCAEYESTQLNASTLNTFINAANSSEAMPKYNTTLTPHILATTALNFLVLSSTNVNKEYDGVHGLTQLQTIRSGCWNCLETVESIGQSKQGALAPETVALLDVLYNLLISLHAPSCDANTPSPTWDVVVMHHVRSMVVAKAAGDQNGAFIEQRGFAEALSACLRFVVLSTHQGQVDNCEQLACNAGAAQTLADVVEKAIANSQECERDSIQGARWIDIAALALGVLTNLLEKAFELTQDALLKGDTIERFGRLFGDQQRLNNESEAEQRQIFSGCLAVALSLLALSDDVDKQDTILTLLAKGMGFSEGIHVCQSLANCLETFGEMTRAMQQQQTETVSIMSPSTNALSSEQFQSIEGEENLVRQLIERLRLIS